MMKAKKPRPTATGCSHHASVRMVSPKPRLTGSAVTLDGIESPVVVRRRGGAKTQAPEPRPPKYAARGSDGNRPLAAGGRPLIGRGGSVSGRRDRVRDRVRVEHHQEDPGVDRVAVLRGGPALQTVGPKRQLRPLQVRP